MTSAVVGPETNQSGVLDEVSVTELGQPRATAFRLVRLAWGCTFMNYFWLKKQRETQGTEPTGS